MALQGIGTDEHIEYTLGHEVNRFRYWYVGLPGLDALEYLQGDNWLGVALSALMQIPEGEAARLGVEALQRLSEATLTPQRRFLLGDCIEAYLPLDEDQRQEFENLLLEESREGVKAMNETSYDRGMKEGREEGRREAQIESLRFALEGKFGELSTDVQKALNNLSYEEARQLFVKFWTVSNLSELGLSEPTNGEHAND